MAYHFDATEDAKPTYSPRLQLNDGLLADQHRTPLTSSATPKPDPVTRQGEEITPNVQSPPNPPAYAPAPFVCCRAGVRPVQLPPSNVPSIPEIQPPKKESQQTWYHEPAELEKDLDSSRQGPRRHSLRSCLGFGSWRRWVLVLAAICGWLLIRYPFSHGLFSWPACHRSRDSLPNTSDGFAFHFDNLEHFSFLEDLETHPGPEPSVTGSLSIEPAPEDQSSDVTVSVSYATPQQWHLATPRLKITESSLHLQYPRLTHDQPAPASPPSLHITAKILLKPTTPLQNLTLRTTNLAITSLPHRPARHTAIHTTTTPITGSLPLLDSLLLTSASGSIDVSVLPGEADASRPEPARFTASTRSGSVRAAFETAHLPRREYRTRVRTVSGAIGGRYVLGAETELGSESGSVRAEVVGVPMEGAGRGVLRTESRSGATEVRVRGAGEGLRAVHESAGSGSVEVVYPGEWEGRVVGESGSGSVRVVGEGFVVDGEEGGVGKKVTAHKGDGDGEIEARTGSGSVEVVVGEV